MNSIRIVYKLSKKEAVCITHRMSMILHTKKIEKEKLFFRSTQQHVMSHTCMHVSQGMIGIFTKSLKISRWNFISLETLTRTFTHISLYAYRISSHTFAHQMENIL